MDIQIHPTAIVDNKTKLLGKNIIIGPYAVIGPKVVIKNGCYIHSHCVIEGDTTLGENNQIFPFCTIGLSPQHAKFSGGKSKLIVGNNNIIREHVTMHPGTDIGTKVIHRNNGEVMHEIVVSCDNPYYTSLIFPLKKDTFLVNSWHHQGLKDIAPSIHVMARSYDGLPEAAIMDTTTHPFMIAVQFHPERLGSDNVIHKQIRSSFFNAIYN